MELKETGNGRVRAWILLRTEEPPEVAAQRVYAALGYKEGQGEDSFVLVRADVVDYHYNIIIPVDTGGGDVLQGKLSEIQELAKAREIAVVPVTEHFPKPPHAADGFITPEEAEAYTDTDTMKVGRQRKSPGMNAWG
jgi:hypothetical protein